MDSICRYSLGCSIRSVAVCLMILLLPVLAGCIKDEKFTHENTTLVSMGDIAPDFEVELLDGTSRQLSHFRGEVVMLIFFSAGCPDCHAEFRELQGLISQVEPEFNILAISRADGEQEVRDFVEQYELTFDVGLDPNKSVYGLYATRYVPRCFLIGRDGKVKALTVEYDETEFKTIWNKAVQEAK